MLIEAVSAILKKMGNAAMGAGRSPDEVKLIAVTKKIEIKKIEEAVGIGLRIFGESRVQEAKEKIEHFMSSRENFSEVRWHLIGHLQKNKAKYAVRLFDLIHAVDSTDLAEEIDKQAANIGKIQNVLLQIKLAEEETKHGVSEEGLMPLLKKMQGMKNIRFEGLMTIPPFFDDPEKARPYFKRLRELRDRAEQAGYRLPELSMGMSGDFETAIQEGATMVRIGTAIFGERSTR